MNSDPSFVARLLVATSLALLGCSSSAGSMPSGDGGADGASEAGAPAPPGGADAGRESSTSDGGSSGDGGAVHDSLVLFGGSPQGDVEVSDTPVCLRGEPG